MAVFASAIGIELALQLLGLGAAFLLRAPSAEPGSPEAVTLLCVGDSHTYGAPLPREDAYPAQLQTLLGRRFPDREFRVLNYGVPGVNSAYVANRLERQILRHRPDMVLVWAGTNNRWNALETEIWGESGAWNAIHRRLLALKLYRLARVAWFSLSGAQDGPAVRDLAGYRVGNERVLGARREKRLSHAEIEPGLAFDMERMVRTARALSTPILFITYPKNTQRGATQTILETAARLGVPAVDSREALEAALGDGRRMGDLIVMASGPHPTTLLYAYVVHALEAPVIEALSERGVLPRQRRSSAGSRSREPR